jgi:hypothetical protein
MEGGIVSTDKFSLTFSIEKGGESGSINFFHPLTLLQTNTTCTIGFINGIHKKKVETPLAFKLSLVEVTGASTDFTPVNITSQIRCFPTLPHQHTLLTAVTQLGVNLIV